MKLLLLLIAAILLSASIVQGATIFESGTLGATGISGEDVFNQVVAGGNVNTSSFVGARFQIGAPVKTSQIGGHFVLAPGQTSGTFFGALIQLDGSTDFPDSDDLSTPDVLSLTTLDISQSSANVFGDIEVTLSPGWYSVIFGSGLFGATGSGAALRNNAPIDDPDHIGFLTGFNWGNRQDDLHFTVLGIVVPEPSGWTLASSASFFLLVAYKWSHR